MTNIFVHYTARLEAPYTFNIPRNGIYRESFKGGKSEFLETKNIKTYWKVSEVTRLHYTCIVTQ
jgi:hypothetical protein